MRTKRTLAGITAAFAVTSAIAQSDGRTFDAAVVLVPGMTLERGGVALSGTWDSGLLRHGDVVHTDNFTLGRYYIVTSDGTVIGVASGSSVAIDGRRVGFDVFRVLSGSANVLGNVNNGYSIPQEFAASLPIRIGNVTVQPSYSPYAGRPIPFIPNPGPDSMAHWRTIRPSSAVFPGGTIPFIPNPGPDSFAHWRTTRPTSTVFPGGAIPFIPNPTPDSMAHWRRIR